MSVSNWVESVQFVEYTLGATALSGTATLSGTPDLDNCVPFMTSHGSSDYYDSHLLDIYFEDTDTIVFKRGNQRNNTLYIKCYVVEFNPDEVRVQHGSFDLSSQTTDTVTLGTTLSGTDRAAMTHFWWSSSSSGKYAYHMVRGRVLNTTSIDFYRHSVGASCQGHWYLFEDLKNNFRVHHNSSAHGSAGETSVIKADRSTIDPLRSFIISSYASAQTDNYTYPLRATCRTFFYSDGTIRNDKGDTNYYTIYWAYQVVEFLDKTKVYTPFDNHLLNSLSAGLGEDHLYKTRTLGNNANISPLVVNPATSTVVVGMMQGICRCDATSAGAVDQLFVSVKLLGNDSLYFQRNGSGENVYLSTVTAVDWAGIDIDIGSNDNPITEGDGAEESFVKSVETFRLHVEENFCYKVLSKGQDWKNCAVFASHYSTSGDYMNRCMHNVYLLEPGIVCAFRWGADGQGIVDVSVVEFWPNQVKVQHKNTTVWNQTTTTTEIEEVSDLNKCFILSKTFTPAGQARHMDSMVRVRFVDETSVEFYRYSSSYEVDTSIFVVEDLKDNFTTKHFLGNSSSSWNDIRDDEHISGKYNTFLICSYASANSGGYPSRGAIRAYLNYEDWLRVNKYDGNYYGLYWYLTSVKFKSNKIRTHQVFANFTPTSPVTSTYLEDFTGHDYALTCMNNVQSSSIRCDTSSSNGVSESFASIRIIDYENRTIEMAKNGNGYNSYGAFVVIDWIGGHYQNKNSIRKHVPAKTMVQSIERIDFYNNASTLIAHLTKGQNIDQCVPFLTQSGNFSDARAIKFYKRVYRYKDPDYFTIDYGAGANGDRYVSCYIVEFAPDVIVQHGSCISDGTIATATINEVDLDRSFLIMYSCSGDWSENSAAHKICGHFKNSTELEFIRTNSSDYIFVSWYVVECTEESNYWQVSHTYKTGLGGAGSVSVSLDYMPDIGKTMFLGSWNTTDGNSYPSRAMYRMYHNTTYNITFNKYDNVYYNMNNANVEVIECSNIKSYIGFVSLSTTSSIDVSFHPKEPLDLSRSMVISGNISGEGRVDTSNSSAWDEGFHHYEFKDGSTVTAKKTGGIGYNTYSVFYAYQFPEYNKYFIEGYVKEKCQPVQRKVALYRSETNELIDSTISTSGTGYFLLETPYGEKHYTVCLDDMSKPDYNHLIYGKLLPTVISGSFAYNEGLTETNGFDIGVPLCYQDIN